jgi:hypothetical protein
LPAVQANSSLVSSIDKQYPQECNNFGVRQKANKVEIPKMRPGTQEEAQSGFGPTKFGCPMFHLTHRILGRGGRFWHRAVLITIKTIVY